MFACNTIYQKNRSLFRDTDIFIASYPRSGNTWTLLLLSDLLLQIQGHQTKAGGNIIPDSYKVDIRQWDQDFKTQNLPFRFIKTHEPFDPAYKRIIYLFRNPSDCLCSYYNYLLRHEDFSRSNIEINDFCRSHTDEWIQHLKSYITACGNENHLVAFISYEAIKANPVNTLKFISNALQWTIEDQSFFEIAVKNQEFNNLQTLVQSSEITQLGVPVEGGYQDFFRKGKVDSAKDELTSHTLEYVNSRAVPIYSTAKEVESIQQRYEYTNLTDRNFTQQCQNLLERFKETMPVKSDVKLHIGCGTQRLPGFVHVDVRPDVKPDVIAEATSLKMFDDNSVDLIYFCHGLEHISPYKVGAALTEWRRVLKPGGTLRLALPDFEALAKLYVLKKVPLGAIVGAVHGGQDYPENTHYWSWDFQTLAQTLQRAGFSNVRRYDTDAVNPPGYDDCSKVQIAGQLISLNVEATKGQSQSKAAPAPATGGQIVNLATQVNGQTCGLKLYVDPKEYTQKLMMQAFAHGQVYEPEVVQAFTQILKPGDGFIDVGAHIGYFSLWAATLVGASGWVVTCEPEKSNYDHVLQNVQLNNFSNVRVLNIAVADENKETQFFVNSDNDGGHALWDIGRHPFNQKSRTNPQPRPIYMATIDAIMEQHQLDNLKLIKIDTEGAEHRILQGAKQTLEQRHVPYVIAELNEFCLQQMGSGQMQLRGFMESLGYETYVLSTQMTAPMKLVSGQPYQSQQLANLLFAKQPLQW